MSQSIIGKAAVQDFYSQNGTPANPPAGQARAFYTGTAFEVIDSTGASILSGVVGIVNPTAAKTTYTGSVSGTAVWSMPFQGSSYKKFVINLAALNDAGGTITYPVAFVNQPYLYGDATAVAVSSTSTTTFTIANTIMSPPVPVSGNVFVEGF